MLNQRSGSRLKLEEKLAIILPVAERLLAQKNLYALTLKEVIEVSGLPRASFLRLIPNKETLIAYLAIKGFNALFTFFERSKQHPGPAKFKFLAIYMGHLFFLRLHPLLYQCIYEVNSPSYRFALEPRLTDILNDKMNKIIGYIQWTIEQAMFNQELKLLERITSYDLAFYIWSGQFGVTELTLNNNGNAIEAAKKYRYYVRQLLDALPWHPTSTELDHDKESEVIAQTIFADELAVWTQIMARA